mmetsp:Transcript_4703/g.7151  ORF Transcript_4703/g.7151 Transcript_4703/m.7151 type:complete len:131 (-) Transcript_4703:195-587(-)
MDKTAMSPITLHTVSQFVTNRCDEEHQTLQKSNKNTSQSTSATPIQKMSDPKIINQDLLQSFLQEPAPIMQSTEDFTEDDQLEVLLTSSFNNSIFRDRRDDMNSVSLEDMLALIPAHPINEADMSRDKHL